MVLQVALFVALTQDSRFLVEAVCLSQEDILNMDQELKGMCLLEIDEVSMLEKMVLAHVQGCSNGGWKSTMRSIAVVRKHVFAGPACPSVV